MACAYAFGALAAPARERFERAMQANATLRQIMVEMTLQLASWRLQGSANALLSPAGLRSRPFTSSSALLELLRTEAADSVVVTDATGRIEYVNDAFVRLCGFSPKELRGQRPGLMLQGEKTDPNAVAKIRSAIRRGEDCRCELTNYHKDGHAYRVAISINPIKDCAGAVRGFVALEHEL